MHTLKKLCEKIFIYKGYCPDEWQRRERGAHKVMTSAVRGAETIGFSSSLHEQRSMVK